MASSDQTIESCYEQKISVADETYQRMERLQRAQWLRAAILGANDGLLSTTSLMLGIGAAKDDRRSMILSGLAGALAGACSMAVGEFVSVSTQRDIEQATSAQTNTAMQLQHDHVKQLDMTSSPTTVKTSKLSETNLGILDALPLTPTRDAPCRNLTCEPIEKLSPSVIILDSKLPQGLSPGRSPIMKVMTEDLNTKAIVTLAQDDKERALPNPYKAAAASALAFLCGSIVPLASAAFIAQNVIRIVVIAVVTSIALPVFGCFGAYLGGSQVRVSATRVLAGGWIAMAITYGLLKPFDRDHDNKDND